MRFSLIKIPLVLYDTHSINDIIHVFCSTCIVYSAHSVYMYRCQINYFKRLFGCIIHSSSHSVLFNSNFFFSKILSFESSNHPTPHSSSQCSLTRGHVWLSSVFVASRFISLYI